MTVPSWPFLVFVLLGAGLFNAVSTRVFDAVFVRRWRNAVWLVLNLAFVWSFSHALTPLLPLAGFLALGYLVLGCLAPGRLALGHRGTDAVRTGRRWAAPAAILLVLAVFVWLKRYSFVPAGLMLPPGAMLVGLSYVFFRVMHLVIDAGQGETERIGIVRYLNFTLNFPAFISGPIQRREDYEANGGLPLTVPDIGLAAWRMVLGAFKVLILSDVLHAWHVDTLAALAPRLASGLAPGLAPGVPPGQLVLTGALAIVLYPLFLYANFSGYTDFVIGAARLFRLQLPENFDRPFSATNFIDFWSRWHISLSQWLRSYVFNPLLVGWMRRYRSARTKQYPAVAAFFITFFLVGAWHGQTSEFLFFGLLQGGGVAGNRLYQVAMTRRLTPAGYGALCANALYRAVSRGLTFTWFAFTLLWFWARWGQIGALAETLGVAGSVAAALATVCGASVILAVPDLFGAASSTITTVLRSRYTRTAFASAMVLAMTIAALVLNLASPEIVYKQF
jgi:alginate O-acetyltransferase complex protein AlgI